MLFPVLLGLVGVAILASLGVWQLRRLEAKEALIAAIEARIAAAPVAIPPAPDPLADRFLPVAVEGALPGQEAPVLTTLGGRGPGYRIVAVLESAEGRRVLVDLGFVPEADRDRTRRAERVRVVGNLAWPDETDRFTPRPDPEANTWFARDVTAMAAALGTEPVLVVARSVEPPLGPVPVPLDASGVRNDHLGYAVTWFGLAAVWAVMSGALALRTWRRTT
nr:SURF1 family protein [Rubellimicrobium sp. CFH 75288]